MRIENLRQEKAGDRTQITATVLWEDCDRPTQEIFFATDEKFADSIWCNPHAFLVGSIIPAMYNGERRIKIDQEICPELVEGLLDAMGWLRHWFYEPARELVKIEAKRRSSLPIGRTPERTGSFFSGGVDSIGTVCANRRDYPLDHPGSIKDGLLIYGNNIEFDPRIETFKQAVHSLSEVAKDAKMQLIPVYTNVRSLDESVDFFSKQFHGAILASVAHALSRRLSRVLIASSNSIEDLEPYGSHPLIDPNYSSYETRIIYDDVLSTRLAKTKLVSEWDVALQNIKVCGPNYPGENCGQCEKCIRTMLALMAVGKLDETKAFPHQVTAEMISRRVKIGDNPRVLMYSEMIPALTAKGRHDLVRVINRKIREFHYGESPSRRWRRAMRAFDQRYLNGSLTKAK